MNIINLNSSLYLFEKTCFNILIFTGFTASLLLITETIRNLFTMTSTKYIIWGFGSSLGGLFLSRFIRKYV